jgi:hypothetical protein
VVALPAAKPASCQPVVPLSERWMRKPNSLLALSVQRTMNSELEIAPTAAPLPAEGAASSAGVSAVVISVYAEKPELLNVRSR